EVMDERLQRLQAALNRDQEAFNRASIGRRCEILLERKGKLPGQLIGKSPWLQSVHLVSSAAIGDVIEVEIEAAWPNSVSGVERVREAA
ncbi:MAG: tRNA (N6-isopentenyl adenosine(37)-C2)-methylthiotransferase MiaB, partial [Sphingomonas sp.]